MAERKRVGILISGRGSNMSALVAAAQAPGCPYEVALVFSNVADAPGLAIAEAAGVPTASLDHRGHGGRALFDAKVDAILRDAGCDLVALAGYMRLLSDRSEEHTSELQSLMRISYAVFCLKKKKDKEV